jgi:hypothetical protein
MIFGASPGKVGTGTTFAASANVGAGIIFGAPAAAQQSARGRLIVTVNDSTAGVLPTATVTIVVRPNRAGIFKTTATVRNGVQDGPPPVEAVQEIMDRPAVKR